MINRDVIYKKAFEIKRDSHKRHLSEYNIYLSAAYASNKRLKQIDDLLTEYGSCLAVTAMSGNEEALKKIKNNCDCLYQEKQLILKKCNVKNIVYDCKMCNDTGYVNGKICDCVKELVKKLTVDTLCEEMPLADSTFDNFDLNFYKDTTLSDGSNPMKTMSAILQMCKNYCNTFNTKTSKNLLFFGSAGLGKTHLTLAIISEIIKKGYIPVYGSAQNLFDTVEKEHFSASGSTNLDTMLTCDLLAIDDLGAEFSTSFSKSVLYNLVNSRILYSKPTIINTNLSMKEIEERYSPRITSRLIGNYDCNKLLGNDIRQIKALKHRL